MHVSHGFKEGFSFWRFPFVPHWDHSGALTISARLLLKRFSYIWNWIRIRKVCVFFLCPIPARCLKPMWLHNIQQKFITIKMGKGFFSARLGTLRETVSMNIQKTVSTSASLELGEGKKYKSFKERRNIFSHPTEYL